MAAQGLIFDLDGTLADTLDTIAAALNDGLSRLELARHPREAVASMVGEGVGELCRRGLPPERRDDDELHTRLLRYVRASYDESPLRHAKLYEGVEAMVRTLGDAGVQLAVLSNKPHPLTVATIDGLGLGGLFEIVLGQRDEFPRKPDPTSVRWILERLDLAPSEALYVGDTPIDMQTAEAAAIPSIAVTWGFRRRDELLVCGPDHVVDDAASIVAIARGEVGA